MLHKNRVKMEDFTKNNFFAAMYRVSGIDILKLQKNLLEEQFKMSKIPPQNNFFK